MDEIGEFLLFSTELAVNKKTLAIRVPFGFQFIIDQI